jgi:hypothetical protein
LVRGRISEHARSNIVGYLALFVALSGTAWATNGPLAGRNTVGSADILNNEVKAPDIGKNAVAAGDIRNAPSGSDAVNADLLDGLDSDAFAPAEDVQVTNRLKVDDPTPGDLGAATVTLLESGQITVQGQCYDNLSLGNVDRAEVLVIVAGGGNASIVGITSTGDDVDNPAFGGGSALASVEASNASSSNLAQGVHMTIVGTDGQVLTADVSMEITDTDGGSTSDCSFAATGVG